jgi:small subunit ribosomal protein S20
VNQSRIGAGIALKLAVAVRGVKAMWRLDIGPLQTYVFACRRSAPLPARADRLALQLEPGLESSVPNIASAKKNMRKTRAATVRNRAQRATLRTALRRAKAAGASPAERLMAVRLLDRAARKGLIHANSAARHKSTLSRQAKSAKK